MMKNELKNKVLKMVESLGRAEVGRRLVVAGVHIDTTMRLLNGTYPSNPKKQLSESIKRALKE